MSSLCHLEADRFCLYFHVHTKSFNVPSLLFSEVNSLKLCVWNHTFNGKCVHVRSKELDQSSNNFRKIISDEKNIRFFFLIDSSYTKLAMKTHIFLRISTRKHSISNFSEVKWQSVRPRSLQWHSKLHRRSQRNGEILLYFNLVVPTEMVGWSVVLMGVLLLLNKFRYQFYFIIQVNKSFCLWQKQNYTNCACHKG